MMKGADNTSFSELGLAVINTELEAISALRDRIDDTFIAACRCLLAVQGRIVVMGMGKSGHIANKIASTLASTGSPAFFVHPAEALHGDMGMIQANDVILAISNSGNTPEIITLLPLIKRLGCKMISLSGQKNSLIAKAADINLDVSVEKEACPLGLAPTASSTTALVMGDALAIALLNARGFTKDDFALSHPGGALGKRLLLRVCDLMHIDKDIPKVSPESSIKQALFEMTQKRLGMTTVTDEKNKLLGIFTDGDVRRMLDKNIELSTKINTVMIQNPCCIEPDDLAVEALELMEQKKITVLVVLDKEQRIAGVLHLHDVLKAGV